MSEIEKPRFSSPAQAKALGSASADDLGAQKLTQTDAEPALDIESLEKGAEALRREMSGEELAVPPEWHLPERLESRLPHLAEQIKQIGELIGGVTYENYQRAPLAFQETVNNILRQLAAAEAELALIETQVNVDYPKVSVFQRALISLLSVVRSTIRENTLLAVLQSNQKREAYLSAVGKFRSLLSAHQSVIREVRKQISDARGQMVENEINRRLENNQNYQSLLRQEGIYLHDLALIQSSESNMSAGDVRMILMLAKNYLILGGEAYKSEAYAYRNQLRAALRARLTELKNQLSDQRNTHRAGVEKFFEGQALISDSDEKT